MVGETLKVHPDRVEALAARRVTVAQRKTVEGLVERRIATRKPAAYLLQRIYMRGVPFYIDERAIVPRSYIGEILDDEMFETLIDPAAVSSRARPLHWLRLSCDPCRDAVSEGQGRRRRSVEGCTRGR